MLEFWVSRDMLSVRTLPVVHWFWVVDFWVGVEIRNNSNNKKLPLLLLLLLIIILYCSKHGTFLKFHICGAYVARVMVTLCF